MSKEFRETCNTLCRSVIILHLTVIGNTYLNNILIKQKMMKYFKNFSKFFYQKFIINFQNVCKIFHICYSSNITRVSYTKQNLIHKI